MTDNEKSDQTYSVQQFIDKRSSDEITYHNYSILMYSKGVEFPITNILYDYDDEIAESSVYVRLTDQEFAKYKYKPWLLAFDMYGSVETVFIVLQLNGILADREFDFKRVRLIDPSLLSDLLGRIYSANYQYINNNRSDLTMAKKNDKDNINSVW